MNICVYGAASSTIDKIYIEQGEALGELLAENNIGLVFGGGANGLMGACARGAYKKGGKITGVVPRFFNVDGVLFDKCTEIIFTDDMRERKRTMENLSDAFVVTPGGIGTFDEFFEIFTTQNLGMHHKPIVILNINGYYDSLLSVIKDCIHKGFVSEKALSRLIITKDIYEIIDRINNFKY